MQSCIIVKYYKNRTNKMDDISNMQMSYKAAKHT